MEIVKKISNQVLNVKILIFNEKLFSKIITYFINECSEILLNRNQKRSEKTILLLIRNENSRNFFMLAK